MAQSGAEAWLIALFCLIAASRVFIFSAGLPFFSNVDEPEHVDLVVKYARGHWPEQFGEPYDEASIQLFAAYNTIEFLYPREHLATINPPPPLWTLPPDVARREIDFRVSNWVGGYNHEAYSPPVYYLAAALWDRIGSRIGLSGGNRLYFLRFMNIPLAALLVWLGYRLCLRLFPGRPDLRIGVPLLLAVFPQDVYYTVNSDVLSPPLFAASLLLLAAWHEREKPAPGLSLLVGLLVGLTFLVKYSNIALVGIFAAVLLARGVRAAAGTRSRLWIAIGAAMAAAAIPVGLWCSRLYALSGSLTGTPPKIEHLGWTPGTLGQALSHPLFSPGGLWYFLDETLKTFWRGELVWHLERIANPSFDSFYVLSSVLFLGAAAVGWLLERRRRGKGKEKGGKGRGKGAAAQKETPTRDKAPDSSSPAFGVSICWSAVGLSITCLALLSISFEYGTSMYPSPEHPFFTSGRLIAGALVPFLILYVDGLSRMLRPIWPRAPATIAAAAVIGVAITAGEVLITREVFSSAYNWFHMP